MVRKMAGFLWAMLLLAGMTRPVSAAEQSGTIRIRMAYGDASAEGAVVTLQYAGQPAEGGYRLSEVFGGGIIRMEDACSPDLAQWLSERTTVGGELGKLDSQGSIVFSGLEEGLYLITQEKAPMGWQCAAPFLVPVPLDGNWEVLAYPKQALLLTEPPRTGEHPAPVFGAMGLILSGGGLYLCIEKVRKK